MQTENHQEKLKALEADYYKRLILLLQDLDHQIESLASERKGIKAQVDLIGQRQPDLRRMYDSSDGEEKKLRGRDAVLAVLRSNEGWMTVREIVEELQLRNWMPLDAKAPNEAARISLRRLLDADQPIESQREGRKLMYRFKGSEAPVMGASGVNHEGSPDGPAS